MEFDGQCDSCRQLAMMPERDPEGNLVVLIRLQDYEPSKLNLEACAKVSLMALESFLMEHGSVAGIVIILDQRNFTLSHLARVPISIPKKFFYYGQVNFTLHILLHSKTLEQSDVLHFNKSETLTDSDLE